MRHRGARAEVNFPAESKAEAEPGSKRAPKAARTEVEPACGKGMTSTKRALEGAICTFLERAGRPASVFIVTSICVRFFFFFFFQFALDDCKDSHLHKMSRISLVFLHAGITRVLGFVVGTFCALIDWTRLMMVVFGNC